MKAAILTDVTRCIGCRKCVEACTKTYGLKPYVPSDKTAADGLSAERWTSIVERPGAHYVRKQCRHCVEPACVSACLVAAMQKTPEGPVVYDNKVCIGCRYCMMACPYGIPRYQWDTAVPYVRKCILCYERVRDGKLPACVEACPEKATIFGDRDDLLAEAKARLAASPGKYVNRVYGDHEEFGGTSVLYLSPVPLDFLAIGGKLKDDALPELTWRALGKVPGVALGVAGLMLGTNFVIGRRMKVADEERQRREAPAGEQEATGSDE
ncbi:MAG: 4Fe-4S ferredoxin [Armatimonadetes bacterium CG_4_10_14_3_um_filter_66_18]|nr:4Fe-4S dicluster domain-containing protein [Armatimonadota bacterium]OIO94880.1 MAG: hypothetical protein AUJ96_27925 [Armatimonadetes bacterium CG2_30_66_41]PIU94278.1 MAG: 4Fe-4S ferredoxin [Armatimonadetes bacterium CG06_land_8_20_14_3_00_66_21]PIX50021.1 MAG: 4Fe-4S ferredoxin [Armatimonadetes bacterium CG_4_8_14_3_um_filter_66_20]PIY41092.1 MAG: 4Fe-4S ferredoxin [Armatimonadetes bacterium CG_4_10_14_3_um_filter_66_18]PIZ41751.1 MAG: 4Fe-4S ferredoxin [Armatimonadetes bacterium CG_4_10